jgi:hypothetical protein
MSDQVNAIERARELATRGRELSAASRSSGSQFYPQSFYAEYAGWQAQAGTFVEATCGRESVYYERFTEAVKRKSTSSAGQGAAILESIGTDIAGGYLRKVADLVVADVFGDFLDMAEHLLAAGYLVPAASLVGAILEDALRRLCSRNNLKVAKADDIAALNNRLASKDVYSNLVRKQVDLWSAVRNAADHGQFSDVKVDDVHAMHKGVVAFLADRLG